MKVAKFGGSSVANVTQLKKVKQITLNDIERNIIVVSAPGKDEEHPTKITDLLFLLHAHIEYGVDYNFILNSIYERYMLLVEGLSLSGNFKKHFELFKNDLTKGIGKDYIVSRGEYFSALIISEYLGYRFIDALDVISMKYDGTIDYNKTEKNLSSILNQYPNIVVPGYYASTPDNQVRLFGRGGSDLTGSILARTAKANLYENWTDVSGIYVADPRIISNPKRISTITFSELRELSFRGARVLQQESVIPLEQIGIPIHIKNTNDPTSDGTLICNDVKNSNGIITGISGLRDFTSLNISKDSDTQLTTALRDVFNLFTRHKININHIPTGIDTFSIITQTDELKSVYFDFINDLRSIDGVISIEEEDSISLIAIVGRNMAYTPGVAGRIFSTLGNKGINIKVIAQASKEISIIIGVKNEDYEAAILSIYNEFY